MKRKKEDGKEVLPVSEQESPSDAGSKSPKDSNDILLLVELLTTKEGRKLLRKVLGPPLPGCEEKEEEEDE